MLGKEIYKIWAPNGAQWTQWVRPVPFIGISGKEYGLVDFTIPKINYINGKTTNIALIIDLPGNNSIKEGIALSKIGFRPIPIYNGTDAQNGAMATTDNEIIKIGLVKGANELRNIQISNDAPPAFLLDSNRMNRFKMSPSIFDNSWDIYGQDLPSAEYVLKNGIDTTIVRGEVIQKDLAKILYKFQLKGIKVFLVDNFEKIKKVHIKKPKEKEIL